MKKILLVLLLFSFIGINANPIEGGVLQKHTSKISKTTDLNFTTAFVFKTIVKKSNSKDKSHAVIFDVKTIQLNFINLEIDIPIGWQKNYLSIYIDKNLKPPLESYNSNKKYFTNTSSRMQFYNRSIKQKYQNNLFSYK
jgi:hypothetical protein